MHLGVRFLSRVFEPLRNAFTDNAPDQVFVAMSNLKSVLRRYDRRIGMNGQLIEVRDASSQITICRRHRVGMYKRGIGRRVNRLASEYRLPLIDEPLDGAFVDCGANIGELGIYARQLGLRYVPFEPEKLEADCCDMNNFGGRPETSRVGLWSEDTTLTFYSKPDSADSSLFQPADAVSKSELKVRALDSAAAELGLDRIAVLKIEAEGAEPEVLLGARHSLARTQYAAVDCGFERGSNKESTLVPCMNFLIGNGFEALDWNPARTTVLFRNLRRTTA